jgi:protein involved in sex pheromone biosynthesis
MTTYFILWYGHTKWGNTKYGNFVFDSEVKISNGKIFGEIVEKIKEECKLKDVIILKIQELGETE